MKSEAALGMHAHAHTEEFLGMSRTHAGRQGTLGTHALQGHLPSLPQPQLTPLLPSPSSPPCR